MIICLRIKKCVQLAVFPERIKRIGSTDGHCSDTFTEAGVATDVDRAPLIIFCSHVIIAGYTDIVKQLELFLSAVTPAEIFGFK